MDWAIVHTHAMMELPLLFSTHGQMLSQQWSQHDCLRHMEATRLTLCGPMDEEGADFVEEGEIRNEQRLSLHSSHDLRRHHDSGATGGGIDRTRSKHGQRRRDTRQQSRNGKRRSATPTSARR
jgi:hypothetical protein